MSTNLYVDIAALDPSRTDGAGERSGRVSLLEQVLLGCVWGRPCLEEMGLRLWLVAERLRPGCLGKTSKGMRKRLQVVQTAAWHELQVSTSDTEDADVSRVVDLLLGPKKKRGVRDLGRRVTLLGYAFVRDPLMRKVLPNTESIGKLWELTADNKRSAVSAGLKSTVRVLVERGYLRQDQDRPGHLPPEIWYAKKRVTREKYAKAQAGNGNRLRSLTVVEGSAVDGGFSEASEDHDAPDCVREERRREHQERVKGIPVKKMFAEMSPEQLRRFFDEQEELQFQRRLQKGGADAL